MTTLYHPKARFFKAMNIVIQIQNYCDDLEIDYERFVPVLKNHTQPKSVKLIEEACEFVPPGYWPSPETFELVAEILTKYEISSIDDS